MLYKLGSLTGHLSVEEVTVAHTTIGWHGIRQSVFYLPLTFLRSVFMVGFSHHGQTVVRLANTVFGVIAVLGFSRLLQLWYGGRTALLGAVLFTTSAWVLHVSRYASMDVLYLAALPALFYVQIGLKRKDSRIWLFLAPVVWGLTLYVPGMVWLVAVQIWLLRHELIAHFKELATWWQSALAIALGFIWLPFLLLKVTSSGHNLLTWLGFPTRFPGFAELAKQFAAVPVHLFIHGPKNPVLWLGKSPVLDAFSLVCCILGIYFYSRNWQASRTRSIFSIFAVGWVLVALGGPVSLSLLIPVMYVFVAAGIGYLLHDWLKVFPRNPFARSLGISLIYVAVAMSVVYNLRAYFVAWPHNPDTTSSFVSKP